MSRSSVVAIVQAAAGTPRWRSALVLLVAIAAMMAGSCAIAATSSLEIKLLPTSHVIEAGEPTSFEILDLTSKRSGILNLAHPNECCTLTIEKISTGTPFLHASYLPQDTVVEETVSIGKVGSFVYAFEDAGTYRAAVTQISGVEMIEGSLMVKVIERRERKVNTAIAAGVIFLASAFFGYGAYLWRKEQEDQ